MSDGVKKHWKIPNDPNVSPEDIKPGADLERANLSKAYLEGADLTKANLRGTDLTQADLAEADLPQANLTNAHLTDANLFYADLTGARLEFTDLTRTRLVGTDLSDADLRGITIDSVEMNVATEIGKQTLAERFATNSINWDAIARAHHDLKLAYNENSLINKARDQHFYERRARGCELKSKTELNPWVTADWLGSFFSRVFIGYGVRVRRLFAWMLGLFVVSTLVYNTYGVAGETLVDNLSYSVRTFTVAPPFAPEPILPHTVMMIETFFGTLSIVLLGYVLSNREF